MRRPGNPTKILQLRFHLEAVLSSARSVTGAQLDMIRQGSSPKPADGARQDPQEHLRLLLLDLLALCRDLTEEELAVARLRFGCARPPTEQYERLVKSDQVERRVWGEGQTLGTKDGEEMLDSPTEAGVKLVRGRRATWPPWQDVADQAGITERQAKRRIEAATGKVHAALVRHAEKCGDDPHECNLCRIAGN